MDRKLLVLDPSTKKQVPRIVLLRRTCAVSILQNFYRQCIKWERDEDGNPIDPIMRDGFESQNRVRILYKTRVKGTGKTVTKLQLYNVETLIESIKSSGSAINPLTNTKFNHEHLSQILKKASERGVIKPDEVNSYLNKYGSCGTDHISEYEPVDKEIEKKKILVSRDQNFLPYYALLNDIVRVERLVYKNLANIENNRFKIGFTRDPQNKIPKVPEEKRDHGAMWHLNQIYKNYHLSNEGKKKKKVPIIKKKILPAENENLIFEDTELNLDEDLEISLLPDYLKHGYNAIQACCYHGNIEMLLFLLQFGGDLSKYDQKTKLLPLHIALLEKQIPLVQSLVMYGVNEQLDFESEYGTAMEMASKLVEEYPQIYSVLFGATEIN